MAISPPWFSQDEIEVVSIIEKQGIIGYDGTRRLVLIDLGLFVVGDFVRLLHRRRGTSICAATVATNSN
jgi:hypothetical protein